MKWNKMIVRIHGTSYIAIPPDYTRLMKLKKRHEFQIELISDGSLKIRPIEVNSKRGD
jgi:hypothetical protein